MYIRRIDDLGNTYRSTSPGIYHDPPVITGMTCENNPDCALICEHEYDCGWVPYWERVTIQVTKPAP